MLLEEEASLLTRITSLPNDAQRLFFRLYLRKVGWHRVGKLEYKDIEDRTMAVSILVTNALIESIHNIKGDILIIHS